MFDPVGGWWMAPPIGTSKHSTFCKYPVDGPGFHADLVWYIQILHSEYFEYLAFYCPGQPNIHHHPTSHVVLLFLFHHPYSCFCPKLRTPHPRSRFAACGKIKILANLSECTFVRWSCWQESHLKIHVVGRKTKAAKQKLPHKPPPAASTHNIQFRKTNWSNEMVRYDVLS